jgi:hypothetical protein
MCHNCRLQKAGIAFKREKQQLRRAPRKAAEKMKPNGSPSYALGNPCGILLASVVLGHPIQQLPEDIHGIAAVRGPVQQLRREATYKSL